MDLNFSEIEAKWKNYWQEHTIYKVDNDTNLPKYYVLDMFPYPSGSGLHVGHPLGYIASDIFARFKRLSGFNVLHPMGYDAFGLPAEQFAIQTGVHPAVSTNDNIAQFRKQMDNLGFSFDWERSVKTSDPNYYKWTQWIFLRMFEHYYDLDADRALPISSLVDRFKSSGTSNINASQTTVLEFSASDWNNMNDEDQSNVLMNYRLMYRRVSMVNWCEALGTVLANDEVKDGVSERGGFPVIKKPMMQWSMRTTAYAPRLLKGLENVEWPESLKTMQSNWIGQSEGARIFFKILDHAENLEIFTTRPDTIFGVTFMVVAPENPILRSILDTDTLQVIDAYAQSVALTPESEKSNVNKDMTGLFTGKYVIHPFTGSNIPLYVSDYVLMDYGTGAIMAVPGDDERDKRFALKFELPIVEIIDRSGYINATTESKEGKLIHSEFLNGLEISNAIDRIIIEIEHKQIGNKIVNYKLRDANFSRQRYWGEPFPIVYNSKNIPQPVPINELPVTLPDIKDFRPVGDGSSPLTRAEEWIIYDDNHHRETDTMPGFAGSSWYFLRYMDPENQLQLASTEALNYWKDVDVYVGGAEHAVGHLLYSRMWHKFLHDIHIVPTDEPFKRLINQGMLQGVSEKLSLLKSSASKIYFKAKDGKSIDIDLPLETKIFISNDLIDTYPIQDKTEIFVHIDFVQDYGSGGTTYLDHKGIQSFKEWRLEFKEAVFITQGGYYLFDQFHRVQDGSDRFYTKTEVEKMSKSKYNVINPDDVIAIYGADVFRLFEMFLGPIEQAKPWDTQSIEGVNKFIKRFWSLYFDLDGNKLLKEEKPTNVDLRILHQVIKKVSEDIDRFSFNTAVSAFMIAVNDFKKEGTQSAEVLMPFVVLLAPFAPFITEEIWSRYGQSTSVHLSSWPKFDPQYIKSDIITYPICINGKKRALQDFNVSDDEELIKQKALELPEIIKWLEGQTPKKIILVKGKMVNIVV